MKTTKAPEKIYLQPKTIEQLPHQNIVYTKPLADNSIEYTRADAFIEKACRCYCDDICDQRLCGMCFYKHDGQGQVKNSFKYNECNELKLLINGLKEK